MTPSFFGSRDRRLFGLYSPASGKRERRGALICPPVMQEHLRSHRSCRVLAERLANKGIDVLRFDYFGLGDSDGESTEVTLASAVEDTRVAIDELRDLAQVKKITLIGLRLGAVIAARAGALSKLVDRLVLWDPVFDGSTFVRELMAEASPILTAEARFEAQGFPLPAELLAEVAELRPVSLPPPRSQVLVAASEDIAPHRRLVEHLSLAGVEVTTAMLPNAPCWTEQGALGVGALPVDLIQAIAGWTP